MEDNNIIVAISIRSISSISSTVSVSVTIVGIGISYDTSIKATSISDNCWYCTSQATFSAPVVGPGTTSAG